MMMKKKLSYSGYKKYRVALINDGVENSDLSPPCGSCNSCCKLYKDIQIEEHELDGDWILSDELSGDGKAKLKLKNDGSCIYLGEQGCTIYERRPETCRKYDCRDFAFSGISIKELGSIPAKMSAETLTVKNRDDKLSITACRLTMAYLAKEHPGVTAEALSRSSIVHAEAFRPVAERMFAEMERLRNTDRDKFDRMVEDALATFERYGDIQRSDFVSGLK